jgi:hypothetical protein
MKQCDASIRGVKTTVIGSFLMGIHERTPSLYNHLGVTITFRVNDNVILPWFAPGLDSHWEVDDIGWTRT